MSNRVSFKSLGKAALIVATPLVLVACLIAISFAWLPYETVRVFRRPVGVLRIIKYSKALLDPANDSTYQSIARRNLAIEMAVIGRTEEACLMSQFLLTLELSQQDEPIDYNTIVDLFGIYGQVDPANKISPANWIALCQPAQDQANLIFEKYKRSKQGSPYSKAFGRKGFGVDHIYYMLGKYYKTHGCVDKTIECQKLAIIAAKETLGEDSTAYHCYLYHLALTYHENKMDVEARDILRKALTVQIAKTRDGHIAEGFASRHIRYCQDLMKELKN